MKSPMIKERIPCKVNLHYKYKILPECFNRLSNAVMFLSKYGIEAKIEEGEYFGPCYMVDVETEIPLNIAETIYLRFKDNDIYLPIDIIYIPGWGFGLRG